MVAMVLCNNDAFMHHAYQESEMCRMIISTKKDNRRLYDGEAPDSKTEFAILWSNQDDVEGRVISPYGWQLVVVSFIRDSYELRDRNGESRGALYGCYHSVVEYASWAAYDSAKQEIAGKVASAMQSIEFLTKDAMVA